jgi:hypothetical protein
MAQVKALLELGNEVTSEIRDVRSDKRLLNANEPRQLEELELAIIAGGDSIPCW